jgi:selT/selW/selH-like putative selenoprotein
LADAIVKRFGERVRTVTRVGSGGVFDVTLNGDFIFRKWEENRFPYNDEILGAIAGRLEKV